MQAALGISAVLGAASSIAGGEASARAMNTAADAQYQAALRNAEVQRRNAAQVRREAVAREETIRRDNRKKGGDMAAAMAQAGIIGAGTGPGIMQQSLAELELNALNTRYEGLTRSNSLLQDAQNTISQANYQKSMASYQAKNARKQGVAGAISTVAQTAIMGIAGGVFPNPFSVGGSAATAGGGGFLTNSFPAMGGGVSPFSGVNYSRLFSLAKY